MNKFTVVLVSVLLCAATVEAEPMRRWPVDIPISTALKDQFENDPAVGTSAVMSGYIRTRVMYNGTEGISTYTRKDGFWVVESSVTVPGYPVNRRKGVAVYHGLTYVDESLASKDSKLKAMHYQEQQPKSWPFTMVKISQEYTSDFGQVISCTPTSAAPGSLKNLPGKIYRVSCNSITNVSSEYAYDMYYSDFLDLTVSGISNTGEVSSIEFEAEVSDYSGKTYKTSFSSPDGRLF